MKTVKNISLLFVLAICACCGIKPSKDSAEATKAAMEVNSEVEKQGTVFLDLTMEQALEKAKAEGKYVLVNFHTKTCVPCKKMEKVVFPNPECGEYVNKKFVPIMIDGEDNGVGTEFAKKYDIFIFPTYLILSPEGSKEGEIQGAEFDLYKFLGMLKMIMHDV